MDSSASSIDSCATVTASLVDAIASGTAVAYFGYGSLVNRVTHRTSILGAVPGRLSGWQRLWRPRPDMADDVSGGREIALLTAGRRAEAAIDGLLVFDRVENLPSVDQREACYHRRPLDAANLTFFGEAPPSLPPLYIYEAFEAVPVVRQPPPILRSYLDAVMQGFMREFGEEGVHRFVDETGGFADTPICEDRAAPVYPRAVRLSPEEEALFTSLLPLHHP